MSLEWTKEKPTKPGWYWFDCPMVGPKPRIGFATEYFFSCDGFSTPMCDLRGEWAGPIPEPKEPQQ